MKTLLFLLIFTQSASALELSAGMRESFISASQHAYGGDSTARLRRLLFDRGFDSLTLNTKLAIAQNHPSYIYRPAWSTDVKGLDAMISLIRLGRGKAIVKPQLVKGEMDNIKPYETSNNIDKKILFYTYQREINPYLKLSRETDYSAFVLGSGINNLYTIENNPELIALNKYVRKSLSPETELIFNLNNIELLDSLRSNNELVDNFKDNFSEISYSINQLNLLSLNTSDLNGLSLDIESLYKKHREVFGSLNFSISNLILPACLEVEYSFVDMECSQALPDDIVKKQLENFAKIITDLQLRDIDIKRIEILSSSTDFEPENIDPKMLYYKKFFKKTDLKKLFELTKQPLRVDSPRPLSISGNKDACIFFDVQDESDKKDNLGRIHSTMLESLLGGFPNYRVKKQVISSYKSGQIKSCDKVFYIASHFSSLIPNEFIEDAKSYMKTNDIMWFNYKFSELQKKDAHIAFEVPFVLMPDSNPTAENTDVGFFQYFEYKGEEFFKKIGWSPLSDNFIASTELHLINIKDNDKVKVLSQARHNKTSKKTPYIVTQKIDDGSIWYIGDLPFSFVHYEDRYLILTDILWDFLEEVPSSNELKALIRIEDINPSLKMEDLNWAMTYLASENVPFSLALIPYYADMGGISNTANYIPTLKPITKYPNLRASLKYAKNLGADFVWHGVAHQVDDFISGYDGTSGSDYEFWLYPENVPIPYDSSDWVINRLEKGEKVLKELEIKPAAWEIPHYAASVLDYYIFGKVFEWTYHRPVMFTHKVIQDTSLDENHLMFSCLTTECREERKALLRNIKVEADYSAFGASFYPYPIYKDSYGQKIIPETLGMIDFAFYSKNTWRPIGSPEDILRRAKKLRVIRGAIASFFWHTTLMNPDARYYHEVPGSFEAIGGKKTLSKVIEGLKELGYQFISISDCNEFPQLGCR